jgi:hypothetical protein
MRRRKARAVKFAEGADRPAPVMRVRKPRRPAPPTVSKVRTPATTRGGVKISKVEQGVRLSRLPAPRHHEPLSDILWRRGVQLAATRRWTPSPVPVPRLTISPDPPRRSEEKIAAQFAKLARRCRRADAEEAKRLRAIEWKERIDKAARGAYQRELTRSFRVGLAAERKAAAIAADDAEHRAKAEPRRPMSPGRYAALNLEL